MENERERSAFSAENLEEMLGRGRNLCDGFFSKDFLDRFEELAVAERFRNKFLHTFLKTCGKLVDFESGDSDDFYIGV